MPDREERVRLTESMIPSSLNFDVKDSSFFRKWSQLPSPEEVCARAQIQHLTGVNPDPRKTLSIDGVSLRKPPPVLFEEMELFIKWGVDARISEAQCLYAIRRYLKGDVPVPEVYGWRTDGNEKYIYMEYVQGKTLEQVWDVMEPDDKATICHELRIPFQCLRQLDQDPLDTFVGNIARGPLYDRAISQNYMPEAGPFTTVLDFHNWLTFLCRRPMPDPYSVPVEPFRHGLPDDCAVKFTHGDLHRSNIVVTSSRPYRVLAIVDWEQSGWLPAYWESCKAQFTCRTEEWLTAYLPMILDQFSSTWDPWNYYTISMGC